MRLKWATFTITMAFLLLLLNPKIVQSGWIVTSSKGCNSGNYLAFFNQCDLVPIVQHKINSKLDTFHQFNRIDTTNYSLKDVLSNADSLTLNVDAPNEAYTGDTMPYTITVGFQPGLYGTAVLTDVIPAGSMYEPGSLSCDYGVCSFDGDKNTIRWASNISTPSQNSPGKTSKQNISHNVPLQPGERMGNVAGVLTADGPIQLALDDGSADMFVGFNNSLQGFQFLWFNRFSPDPADFPFVLQDVSIIFGDNGVEIGDPIDLVIYQDADGDGDPSDATWLATNHVIVQSDDGQTWNNYQLTSPLALFGPGDILIGAINRYQDRTIDPPDHPAALDMGSTFGRSWVALWSSDPPDPANLPSDGYLRTIDSLGFPGNWMIRGTGETLPTQVKIYFNVEITSQGQPIQNTANAYWEGLYQAGDATTNIFYPAISFTKTVSAEQGVCGSTHQLSILRGALAYYCYSVTNTGNIALTIHDLFDDKLGQLYSAAEIPIAPGMSESYLSSMAIMTDTVNSAIWTAYADETHHIDASDNATVTLARADLSLTKTGPIFAQQDDLITYSISVENFGPQPATNIIITDTLPTDATIISASPGCAAYSGIVSCSYSSLADGESLIVQITITMNGLGVITNTATVKANELDDNLDNNRDTWQTELVIPDIVVDTQLLSQTLFSGEKGALPLLIKNAGKGKLSWNLTEAPDFAWLDELPKSGDLAPGDEEEVMISFDAKNLNKGWFTTTIMIASNDPDEDLIKVIVNLLVKEPRHLFFIPTVCKQ